MVLIYFVFRLHAAEARSAEISQELEKVKVQLSREQLESRAKDEKIQRLEKRLLFVTKVSDMSCDCHVTYLFSGERGLYECPQFLFP